MSTDLSTVEVIRIWRLEDDIMLDKGVHLLMHDVEGAGLAELEGPVGGERVRPRERRIEEVGRHVHVVVA